MSDLPDLPAGVYRHYKGPLYLVLGYGHDANADTLASFYDADDPDERGWRTLTERAVVVYVGLQLDGAHTGPRLAIRTASDFHADVCGMRDCPQYGMTFEQDGFGGCIRCKDAPTKRFVYVGPGWDGNRRTGRSVVGSVG